MGSRQPNKALLGPYWGLSGLIEKTWLMVLGHRIDSLQDRNLLCEKHLQAKAGWVASSLGLARFSLGASRPFTSTALLKGISANHSRNPKHILPTERRGYAEILLYSLFGNKGVWVDSGYVEIFLEYYVVRGRRGKVSGTLGAMAQTRRSHQLF